MSTPALAQTVDLVKRFRGAPAVDGVSLEVGRGEVLGLLGANGAGKTTVIRMLLGLLAASDGQVRIFGRPPGRAGRRRLGYVPQTLGLYDDLTVRESLAFAAAAFGCPEAVLDPDLAPAAATLVHDLPLGLQRRVAFVQALGHRPELLVLDEPTSGVDPLGRARLWDSIRQAAEAGAGVLVTTHSMGEALQCDRLVVMAAGRVVAAGTADAIIAGATAVQVLTDHWEQAFTALDGDGLRVALVGRALRVPAATPEQVRAVLSAAGIDAHLTVAPATLEESFVALAAGAAPAPVRPGRR